MGIRFKFKINFSLFTPAKQDDPYGSFLIKGLRLKNQHAVTITEKPVLFINSLPVSAPDYIITAESRCEHQKSGPGKMKIGQKSIDSLKSVARVNK